VSERAPRITGRDLASACSEAAWAEMPWTGSHMHLRRVDGTGRVTIPVPAGETLHPKTLASILDQAGLTYAQLRELL